MQDKRLLHSVQLRELLSYGPDAEPLELLPLNVLIGPNGSGKTNLIEAVSLLHATPSDLTAPIRDGGGVSEWLWQGKRQIATAQITAFVSYPEGIMPLRHRFSFTISGQRLELVDEAIENQGPSKHDAAYVYFFYRYQHGSPVFNVRTKTEQPPGTGVHRKPRSLRREDLAIDQSVLAQRKDPDQYPELTYLADRYSKIRLYREWNLGRYTAPRLPKKLIYPKIFFSKTLPTLDSSGMTWSIGWNAGRRSSTTCENSTTV